MLRPLSILLACALPLTAVAQERPPSHCHALAQALEMPFLHKAAWIDPVAAGNVRIGYIGHASFLIQTDAGRALVTDYTGALGGADVVPDVVTMNNAHVSHFTWSPDPDIPHVLEGWANYNGPRAHNLDLGDVLVRNVHTDIRQRDGDGIGQDGNSVFIFEAAGLCIGHLGHLHHVPDDAQFAAIGRLDVVMAAVDGGVSLDTASMIRVMERFRARVVIPMHWFGRYTLGKFTQGMEDGGFDVVDAGIGEITLSQGTLPSTPTVMVLQPGRLSE